jgi:hypothetical protein
MGEVVEEQARGVHEGAGLSVNNDLEVIADRTGGTGHGHVENHQVADSNHRFGARRRLGRNRAGIRLEHDEDGPEERRLPHDVGGGIDLAAVQLATLDRKKRIRVTFRLHSRALQGSLQQPGGMRVTFIKDKRTSRVVTVVTEDGVLRAEVCSNSRGRKLVEPYDCSSLPVTQVDATTYRAMVKRTQVKEGATVLKWSAASMDLSNGFPVSDQLTARNGEPFRWRL